MICARESSSGCGNTPRPYATKKVSSETFKRLCPLLIKTEPALKAKVEKLSKA